jgi:hypothetical protein
MSVSDVFADCSLWPQKVSNPYVDLTYDRTTSDKSNSPALIGQTVNDSIGSDASGADARLAIASELSGSVSALRYSAPQPCGGSGDSRNQPICGNPETAFGTATNGRSDRTSVWVNTC